MDKVPVLDHGYVMVVESWGSDEHIIESARMSTGKGFNGWGPVCAKCGGPVHESLVDGMGVDYNGFACDKCGRAVDPKPGDEKLLRFLYENGHRTPFEMAGVTIEVCAPIFVFREWHRHRTQSYNEQSARYVPLPDVNYIPSIERLMLGSDGKNKQAGTVGGAEALTETRAREFRENLRVMYLRQETLYQYALAFGVPKELARIHLPVGRYSRMRASANLRNWLGFLALRSTAKNPAAQWEIRQYADAAHSMLSAAFPRTLALFDGGAK